MQLDQEYIPLDTIGFGGYARVVKVKHRRLGYVRALRIINEIIESEESPAYQSFLEECRTLLRLGNGNHPNIINISQPKLIDKQAAVEMEYIRGKDLETVLKDTGCFSTKEVIKLLKDISSALAYCHYDIYEYCVEPADNGLSVEQLVEKYRVIHNDIHAKNIMLKKDGVYILLDFGLSFTGSTKLRSSIRRGGVDEYKAPEKWDNAQVLTVQSDIYSLGILLYECLTGSVPFPLLHRDSAKDIIELEQKHKHAPVPDCWSSRQQHLQRKGIEAATQDYPAWLDYVILRCLEKDPAKRFANGKDLHQYVLHCLEKDERNKQVTTEELTASHQKEISRYQQQLQNMQAKLQQVQATPEANETHAQEKYLLESSLRTLQGQLELKKAEITRLQSSLLAEQSTHKQAESALIEARNTVKQLQQKLTELPKKEVSPITKQVSPPKPPPSANHWLGITLFVGAFAAVVGIGIGRMIDPPIRLHGEPTADTASSYLEPSTSAIFTNTTAIQSGDDAQEDDTPVVPPKKYTEEQANAKLLEWENTLKNTETLLNQAEIEAILLEYPELKEKIVELLEDKIQQLLENNLSTEAYDNLLRAIRDFEATRR
ncbi:MAG: protein kinase [Spirosomataceae bacterium]